MKPIIYLNSFKYKQTSLARIFFYHNPAIEQCIKDLTYVHYSQQYKCYYIRWREQDFKQLIKDFKDKAIISTEYFDAQPKHGKKKEGNSNDQNMEASGAPIVTLVHVNDKAHITFPYRYESEWVKFLNEIGGIFEPKRKFWIVGNYLSKQDRIRRYFREQGCRVRIKVKHDEKILNHLRKNPYKEDKEIRSFVKVMTLQGAGKRTIENYASQIKKLKNYYEGKPVSEIADEEIMDYMFFLREELSYSASAQNIVVSAIKRFFLSLTEREFNPYHIPRPVTKKLLPKVLDKDEVTKMLKLDLYIKHKCILFLMYSCGIRVGELINLKVEDIGFDNNTIVIKKGKGDKDRLVSLPDKLKGLLIQYLQSDRPNIYFFEGQRGGKYSAASVQKVVKRAALKAGIDKRVTPHMLRHSYATHLHDSGMDIRNIQRLLGHTSTKTTEIYTYISKRDIGQLKSPLEDLDV